MCFIILGRPSYLHSLERLKEAPTQYSEALGIKPVDDELERLKKRKLLELQRRLMEEKRYAEAAEPEERSPREVLDRYFVGRAWEVFNAASAQFPNVMTKIEEALVRAIEEGRVKQRIDGESLFYFLKQLGLPVRLHTTIMYKEHGELKTIEQRMRERS